MTISRAPGGAIILQGDCSNEEAESLLQLLLAAPGAEVDWRLCTSAHSAVVQVLLAAAPPLRGPPANEGLARWVGPAVGRDPT